MFKMAERSDGCSGETLLAPCIRKKRLQRKMTTYYYRIGAKKILACSASGEMIVLAFFICLCLETSWAYVQ